MSSTIRASSGSISTSSSNRMTPGRVIGYNGKNGESADDDTTSSLPPKIYIRFVKAENEMQKPLICSFPGGVPESLSNNETASTSTQQEPPRFVLRQTETSVHKNNTNSNNVKYIKHTLMGEDESCTYTASVTLPTSSVTSVSSKRTSSSSTSNKIVSEMEESQTTKMTVPVPAKGQRSRMYVGILDKVTNQLIVHETFASGNVFALKQSVPSYKRTAASAAAAAAAADGNTSHKTAQQKAIDSYMNLHNDFGSAKKQRVIKSQQANRVKADSVIGSGSLLTDTFLDQATSEANRAAVHRQRAIDAASATSTDISAAGNSTRPGSRILNDAIDAATEQWRKQFLPPYDTETTKPYKVYNFDPVCGDAAWNYLIHVIDICFQKGGGGGSSISTDGTSSVSAEQTPTSTVLQNPIDLIQRDPKETREMPRYTPQQMQDMGQRPKQPKGDYWNESIQNVLNKLKKRYVSITTTVGNSSSTSTSTSASTASTDINTAISSNIKFLKERLAYTILLNHYMNLIILLHNTYRGRPVKGPDPNWHRFLGTPIAIGMKFLELFATPVEDTNNYNARDNNNNNNTFNNSTTIKYTISKVNLDRCYVHLLLLYLRADGGDGMKSDNVEYIFHDLQLDPKHGTELYRQAGCTVIKRSNGSISVSLPTPLTFPNVKRMGPSARTR